MTASACDQTVQLPTILHPSRTRPCTNPAKYWILVPDVTRSSCCGHHLQSVLDAAMQLAAELDKPRLALVTRDGER